LLVPVIKGIQDRVEGGSFCVVAGHGMIREKTIERLARGSGMEYILGCRMRKQESESCLDPGVGVIHREV
jgi:hypothetical protein